jgi:hypothetical protein
MHKELEIRKIEAASHRLIMRRNALVRSLCLDFFEQLLKFLVANTVVLQGMHGVCEIVLIRSAVAPALR